MKIEKRQKREKFSRKKRPDPKAWAKKYLKSGWEWEKFSGFGEGKKIRCDVCGKADKIRGEYIEEKGKWIYRCEECRRNNLLPKN